MNQKIARILELIKELEDREKRSLSIVETGSIRNTDPKYEEGDGHSTRYIAEYIKQSPYKHRFTSIDLNTVVADEYLRELKLKSQVKLIEGNSLDVLPTFTDNVDFVYLDSGSNPQLVLDEFKIIWPKVYGMLVVNSVYPESPTIRSGHGVLSYVVSNGLNYKLEGSLLIVRK